MAGLCLKSSVNKTDGVLPSAGPEEAEHDTGFSLVVFESCTTPSFLLQGLLFLVGLVY